MTFKQCIKVYKLFLLKVIRIKLKRKIRNIYQSGQKVIHLHCILMMSIIGQLRKYKRRRLKINKKHNKLKKTIILKTIIILKRINQNSTINIMTGYIIYKTIKMQKNINLTQNKIKNITNFHLKENKIILLTNFKS